jgi:hypothetical protein
METQSKSMLPNATNSFFFFFFHEAEALFFKRLTRCKMPSVALFCNNGQSTNFPTSSIRAARKYDEFQCMGVVYSVCAFPGIYF